MADGSGWEVKGQLMGQGIGPNGGYTKGMSVQFVTGLGHGGEIFLTDAEYNAPNAIDLIRERVADKAAQMDAVASLKG